MLGDGVVERNRVEQGGVRILLRIGRVDAVDLGGLQDDLGTDLGTAQGGCRVGGEERIAGTGGEDHHFAFFQVLQGFRTHVRLDDLLDADGRHDACNDADVAHGIGQGQCIHHGGKHAHVVGGGTVHALRARRDATEDIAAANHDCQFHTQFRHLGHIGHHALDRGAVDAVGIIAHQGFAGQLEEDALVGWF